SSPSRPGKPLNRTGRIPLLAGVLVFLGPARLMAAPPAVPPAVGGGAAGSTLSVASVSGTTAASAKPLQEKPKAAATAPGVGKPLRTAPAASTTMAGAALPSGPRPVQAILIEGT